MLRITLKIVAAFFFPFFFSPVHYGSTSPSQRFGEQKPVRPEAEKKNIKRPKDSHDFFGTTGGAGISKKVHLQEKRQNSCDALSHVPTSDEAPSCIGKIFLNSSGNVRMTMYAFVLSNAHMLPRKAHCMVQMYNMFVKCGTNMLLFLLTVLTTASFLNVNSNANA